MKQLLILLCVLLPLYSQDGRGKNNGVALRDKLELNEDQLQKLSKLRKEHRTATYELKQELKILRKQLFEEYTEADNVEEIAKRSGEIHITLTKKMANHISQIAEILTVEQFKEFKELKHSGKKQKR
jgi:Spy/CpxP family protein refolding chaperone